ncbi:MAG: RidA family protein [Campylobacter sp.]
MKKIATNNAPAAIGPYSQAIFANGFLFSSGQIAINPQTGELVDGGITAQTRQVFANLGEVLKATQMGFEDVVKTTVFLTDMNDFGQMNAIYSEFFTQNLPARSAVAVKTLPKGALIEIELIATKQ